MIFGKKDTEEDRIVGWVFSCGYFRDEYFGGGYLGGEYLGGGYLEGGYF